MNKFAQRLLALTAVLACVALAGAQVGGGGGNGGGGGGRGGQRGQGGGMRRGGGNSELSLALRADVAKEISVTDDQKTKLTDLQTKQREAMRAQFGQGGGAGAGGGQRPDPAEMQKRMAEQRTAEHKALVGILNDTQMKRLGELLLQREGFSALNQEATQKALGLSTDQISKIKDLQSKQQEANQALMQKMRDQEMTREELTAARDKNQKTLQDELAKVLTADQAAKFKDMQGKPFKFEETNRGGGR